MKEFGKSIFCQMCVEGNFFGETLWLPVGFPAQRFRPDFIG